MLVDNKLAVRLLFGYRTRKRMVIGAMGLVDDATPGDERSGEMDASFRGVIRNTTLAHRDAVGRRRSLHQDCTPNNIDN